MPSADLAGHRIGWREGGGGSGAPALLLHCTLAHSGAWRGVAAHLGRWAAPDLPGHGVSADVPPGADLLRLCAGVAGALRDRTGAADLVGHSYGAVVALRLALDAPERVRSLTLIEPVLFAAARGTPAHAAYEARHAPVAEAVRGDDPEAAARAFAAVWGDGRAWADLPPAQRAYMAERIALVPRQAPGIAADDTGILAPGGLEGLAAPVLLIEGADSPPVAGAIASALAERLPDARRVTVEGAGHMAPVTHPDAVGRAVADHLANV